MKYKIMFVMCLLMVMGFAANATNTTDATKVNISDDSIAKIVAGIVATYPAPIDPKKLATDISAALPPTTVDTTKLVRDLIPAQNPLTMHGTEYILGQQATPFLQLKDQQGNSVINGTCQIDIFYPNKTQAVNDAPMLYIPDSDGLYFYTYTPLVEGLYPMGAHCMYSNIIRWYYTTPGYNPFSQYGIDCGTELINMTTYAGTTTATSPVVLNTPTDWQYVQTASAGGGVKIVNATFKFNGSVSGCKINKTLEPNLNLFYMGEASAPASLQFYIWNWNTSKWDMWSNNTQVGLASATATSGATDYVSATVKSANYTQGDGTVIMMGYATSGVTFTEWWDWLAIETSGNGTVMVDLKGSGELHISPATSCTALTAEQNATLYNTNAKATQINDTQNQTIYPQLTGMPASVWAYGNRDLTSFGTLITDIWASPNRTLTDWGTLVADIWANPTRTLTSFGTLVADMWGYTTRLLTGFSFNVEVTGGNVTNVLNPVYCANCTTNNLTATDVWDYTNRTLTENISSGLTAADVWTYTNRTLTENPSNLTAADVWNYATRELTQQMGNSTLTADEVWSYINRTITQTIGQGNSNLTSADVWAYATRELTTSMLSAGDVWGYGTRTLTTALQNISAADVWNYADRNLTSYGSLIWDIQSNITASMQTTFYCQKLGQWTMICTARRGSG
jgi:hypothetical protein